MRVARRHELCQQAAAADAQSVATARLRSAPEDTEVWIRSLDSTADRIHAFANLSSTMAEGQGRLERIDRALFKGTVRGLAKGDNTLMIVTFEPSGTHSVQGVTAVLP
jgi:hypothetical protein